MFAPIDGDDPVLETAEDEGGVYAVAPLAFCSESKRIAALEARLSPALTETSALNASVMEFFYSVCIFNLADLAKSFATQDRRVVASGLPRICVAPIAATATRSASILVKKVAPLWIYRVAATSDMPEKALRKHLKMTKHFIDLGYEVTESEKDPAGRVFWLARRATNKPIPEKNSQALSLGSYHSPYVENDAKRIPINRALQQLPILKAAIEKQIARGGRSRAA